MSITRRRLLATAAAGLLLPRGRARGGLAIAPPLVPAPLTASQTPEIHISYGQSWRSNEWSSFGAFSLNPGDLVALHVPSIGSPTFAPGPLPNSAGINLPSAPDGYTGYGAGDTITLGRCAIIAQQALRRRAGASPTPIVEFCAAYPGSDWGPGVTCGGGGGLAPGGTSWANQTSIINAVKSFGDIGRFFPPIFRSLGYTQGGSGCTAETLAQKEADLTTMIEDYDGYELPGTHTAPLNVYLNLPAAISEATSQIDYAISEMGTVYFCATNAPGQGGLYSGRCYFTAPSYPYPFDAGADDIHTGPYGTVRWGEMEGYVKHQVEDNGLAWTPLWRPLSGGAITRAGQVLTVPLARPASADFAAGVLSFAAGDDPANGFTLLPAYGFNVKRGGSDLAITSVAISGLDILLTVGPTLNPGDQLEVSYCYYGPGDGNNGYHSGIWGNVVMRGPASVLVPGATIDAWLVPFDETVTV